MGSFASKALRIFTLLLVVLLMSSVFLININADTAVFDSNNALQQEVRRLLNEKTLSNSATETGRRINILMGEYEDMLDLLTDEELAKQETADLINLYYEQGIATNDVAWIFYSHVDSFDQEGKKKVTETHDAIQAQIANHTDASILSALTDASYKDGGLCARMYYSIYCEKLDDLLIAGDSTAVKSKVASAKLALQDCTDFSLGSTQFDTILNDTSTSVDVQRNQDKALAELDAVFAILCPDEDLSQNEAYLSAKEIDDNATTTIQMMNTYLKNAVLTQLSNMQTGTYVDAYISDLMSAISAEFEAAGGNRIAEVTDLLADHKNDLFRAQAKDTIKDYLVDNNVYTHVKMVQMEAYYNADSGVIDTCQTEQDVLFEVKKAKMRADIYIKYLEAIDAITNVNGDTAAADSAYTMYDDLLVQATVDNADERYHTAVGALEVITYETKHKNILEKQAKDIELSDKSAILSAINDAKSLSTSARATLKDKLEVLATKYTKITQQEISKELSGNELHHSYVNELQLMASDLALSGDITKLAEDFDALIAEADALVAKAREIDKLLDRYYGIITDDENDSFAQSALTELESIAKTAADKIVSESVANAAGTSEQAIVALNRAEAKAQIDVKASQRNDLTDVTKQRVQSLVAAAKAEIDGITDALAIENVAKNAVFAIQKEFDVQDMTSAAETLKSEIGADGHLTAEQKKSLTDRIDAEFGNASSAVRDSADTAAKDSAISSFNGELDSLSNEAELKSDKMEQAALALNTAKQTADGFSYLTAEQRTAVKDELQSAYDKLADDLVPELDETEINSAATTASTAMSDAIADGQAKNAAAKEKQIADAKTAIGTAEQQTLDAIDALAFLDDTAIAALKAKVTAAADKAEADLAGVQSTADINAVQAAALGSMDAVKKEGVDKDNAAKAIQQNSSKGELDTKKAQINDAIEDMSYLTDEEKAELKAQTERAVNDAVAAIESGESTEKVEKAKSDALSALDGILASAKAQDLDNAKAAAVAELTSQKNSIDVAIDGFKYLDEETRASIKDELAQMLAYTEAEIAAAESVEAVERLRNNAADALDNKSDEALAAEDNACVDKLTPVVIAIGAVGIIEAVVIAFLLSKRKKHGLAAFVPLAPILPYSLKLQPTDMWTLTGVLAFADVVMGVIILYLALQLVRHKSAASFDVEDEETLEQVVEEVMEQIPEEPEVEEEEIIEQEPEPVAEESCEDIEADTVELYSGTRRAEINIDTISKHFADGETVTLNSLKAKKLISRQAGYVKVLARGDLDKKITVVAQSFSAAAIKAIVIENGGLAIVDKPAPERRH